MNDEQSLIVETGYGTEQIDSLEGLEAVNTCRLITTL